MASTTRLDLATNAMCQRRSPSHPQVLVDQLCVYEFLAKPQSRTFGLDASDQGGGRPSARSNNLSDAVLWRAARQKGTGLLLRQVCPPQLKAQACHLGAL